MSITYAVIFSCFTPSYCLPLIVCQLLLLLLVPCHSFVVDLAGCRGSPAALAGFGDGRAVLVINAGVKVQLAKFEICTRPGCFDPAAEAAKLKGAKRCVNGSC
jgi:hypothetical protein